VFFGSTHPRRARSSDGSRRLRNGPLCLLSAISARLTAQADVFLRLYLARLAVSGFFKLIDSSSNIAVRRSLWRSRNRSRPQGRSHLRSRALHPALKPDLVFLLINDRAPMGNHHNRTLLTQGRLTLRALSLETRLRTSLDLPLTPNRNPRRWRRQHLSPMVTRRQVYIFPMRARLLPPSRPFPLRNLFKPYHINIQPRPWLRSPTMPRQRHRQLEQWVRLSALPKDRRRTTSTM
jgi:hypothetical protein